MVRGFVVLFCRAACCALGLLFLWIVPEAAAQDIPPPLPTPRPDTSAVAAPDSLAPVSVPPVRAATPRRAADDGDLDQPIQFAARDSLILIFGKDGGERGRLVGQATATYDDVQLQAHTIDLFFDRKELRANRAPGDTSAAGRPVITQSGETFTGATFTYNLETSRGRVVGAETTVEDGFIRAGVAKVREDSTLYILDGQYTTCECEPEETPSYSLRSRRMKVVDEKWIYTGPIQLFIYNVPTPLWLPFGFLPAQEGRRSGILPPQYGEDQRGFYLQNWGYYWAINDYFDLQLRAGLWTRGSWQLNPTVRYARRYRYNGSLTVDYLRERSTERDDPDFVRRSAASLRWSHQQTLSPTASLQGNVNLVSSTSYLRTVSEQYDDNVRQDISSAITYTKRWPAGGRSFSLNLRQNQVLATDAATLTLPRLSFSQSTRTPFKRGRRAPGEDESWYEKITVSYNGSLNNTYTFRPLPDDTLRARGDADAIDIAWYEALFDPEKYERATGETGPYDFTATHRIPVAAPFSINRLPLLGTFRLNVAPNFSYTENWFIETERQVADSTGRAVRRDESGFFALRQFSTGVTANTTFYGIFPVGVGPYQGLRHTVRPSIGFNYSPDFSSDRWGYTRLLREEDGTLVTDTRTGEPVRYAIARGVQAQEQQALSFTLDNVFETRRVAEDSTGEVQRRTLKLFNLNAGTSYNFAADSMRLGNISLSGRARVLRQLNLTVGATFSPYALDSTGTRQTARYLFSPADLRFARLTSLRINGDFALSGGQRGARATAPVQQQPGTLSGRPDGASMLGAENPLLGSGLGPTGVDTDFSIPWRLTMRFSYTLNKSFAQARRTFTVNSGFDFSLTPNWRVSGQSGYDFERQELVTTSINLHRNFECWEMSFHWRPFGEFKSWGFDLHVKSGKLRDLLRIRQPRSEVDRGFGQVVR